MDAKKLAFNFGNLSTNEKALALVVGIGIMFIAPKLPQSLHKHLPRPTPSIRKQKTPKTIKKAKAATQVYRPKVTPYKEKDFETVAVIDGKTGEIIGEESRS
jgi:hypothetical protein